MGSERDSFAGIRAKTLLVRSLQAAKETTTRARDRTSLLSLLPLPNKTTTMAPKRKEPSTEPARRSTRTTAVEKPAAAAPKAPKVVKVATAPAAKKAKAVAVEEKEEEEDEEEKEVPEAKKAKVVEEEKVPKGVGEVVPDVTLKNGTSLSRARGSKRS